MIGKIKNQLAVFAAALVLAVSLTAVVRPGHANAATAYLDTPPDGRSALVACKSYENSYYGPLWRITVYMTSSGPGGATINITRYGNLVSSTSIRSYPGQWTVRTVYASAYYADVISGSAGYTGYSGGAFGAQYVTQLPNC